MPARQPLDSAKLKTQIKMAFLDVSLDSPKSRFRAAFVLAVIADAVQMIAFPLFAEGALSRKWKRSASPPDLPDTVDVVPPERKLLNH